MTGPAPNGDRPRLSWRELSARRGAHPFLHRSTRHVSFRPLKDEVGQAQPASLCAFLTRHGVHAVVVEEVPTLPELHLDGAADLDRVQALLEEWQAEDGDGDGDG
jgi:hypothetical protein